jgi:hypothetical protein
MAKTAANFQQDLGTQIERLLGKSYKFYKSRCELRAKTTDGHNVIILSGSNKYSPHISIDFYFGRNFAAAKEVEKMLGKHQFYYHIQQYSPNRKSLKDLPYNGAYTWSVDINNPPITLATEIVEAISGIADPFFNRFAVITEARDTIANNAPWCFGGKTHWRQLLMIDLALEDLSHFEQWAKCLDDLGRVQSEEIISQFITAKSKVSKK